MVNKNVSFFVTVTNFNWKKKKKERKTFLNEKYSNVLTFKLFKPKKKEKKIIERAIDHWDHYLAIFAIFF